MHRWIKTLLISLALIIGVGGSASVMAACSSPAPYTATSFDGTPGTAVMGPDGQQYCGWMYSPAECTGSPWPAAPYAMPTTQPVYGSANYSFFEALFMYHLMYHSFYNSGFYYDRYLQPNHVVVNRTTYINNSSSFDRSYSSQESSAANKGVYKSKNGQTVPAKKLPSSAFSGGNQKSVNGGNAARPTPRPVGGNAPQPAPPAYKAPKLVAPRPAPAPARPGH